MDYRLEDDVAGVENQYPSLEHDLVRAKMFLQKHSPESGDSLYDHLSQVLNKILAEQPENIIDFFEEYSRTVKEARFAPGDLLQDSFIPPHQYEEAKQLLPFLQPAAPVPPEGVPLPDDLTETPHPDLMELAYFLEQAGIGLPKTEMFCITLAIKQLALNPAVEKIRLWGKIFGLKKNYYVAECEWNEDDILKRIEEIEAEKETKLALETAALEQALPPPDLEIKPPTPVRSEKDLPGEGEPPPKPRPPLAPLPVSLYKPPPEVPVEIPGTGCNKKVYYVCNEPGKEWILLPDVTPQQIQVSRKIVRYFTGNLDTEIHTYPPFPGTEKHYLRATIARISAGTQVSPLGYYTFGGGEGDEEESVDDEEEGGEFGSLSINTHYDPLPMRDLLDPSMAFWVHHSKYILKQGRTTWWNPGGDDMDEDAGEEEDEGAATAGEHFEKETGPPLLTPLSEDASMESTPSWTIRCTSLCLPEHSAAVIRSNLWPGSFAFASGRKVENIYLGWGHKYNSYNYSPENMPMVLSQYPLGPEIMETTDPTFEQEEAWRIAHLPKEKPPKTVDAEAEEAGAGGDDDEDDDDDDDDDDDEEEE